jgi:thiosulfate/3-mercaptopyruvate sulfurtransferase
MTPFPTPLVSTSWLDQNRHDPGIVILDASWYLPVTGRHGRQEYEAAHIPGARYFDLDELSARDTSLPHMLPDPDTLGARLGALGIGPESKVVVYDGSGGNLSAARGWWMLRVVGHQAVAVLDGGLPRWRAEGRPLSQEPERWKPVSFTPRLDHGAVRSKAQLEAALQQGNAQVVDMRSAGRFRGSDPEPRAGLSSGHMPGAINLPYQSLVDSEGKAYTGEALRRRLTEAGIDPHRPIIATCGSGVSACTLLLALDTLGLATGSLYDGSWSEWASTGGTIVKEA